MIFRSKPASADRDFDDSRDRRIESSEVTPVYDTPGVARFHFQLGDISNKRFTNCSVDLNLQDILDALPVIAKR